MLAGGAARAGVSAGQSAVRAGARMSGGASAAYTLARAASGDSSWRGRAAGMGGVMQAGAASAMQSARSSVSRGLGNPGETFNDGARAAFTATGGRSSSGGGAASSVAAAGAPRWAQALRREQGLRDAGMTATHVVASGDRGGSADGPKLRQEDD
jgi:type IV secretion system protein TrbL